MGASAYPAAFDDLDSGSPVASSSRTNPSLSLEIDDLNSAVDKLQTVLGLNPQGDEDDVAARLDALYAAISAVTLSIDIANLGWSGAVATLVAAENLVVGDVCYLNGSSKLAKGDADAIATASVQFIALGTISTDASGLFGVPGGFMRNDTWNWTAGGTLYLSTVAGAITQTPPSGTDDVVQILGVAYSADLIWWNPQLFQAERL